MQILSGLTVIVAIIVTLLILTVVGALSAGAAVLLLPTFPFWFQIVAAVVVFLLTVTHLIRD